VLDRSGRCIAAISVTAPEFRLSDGERPAVIEAVCKAAEKLSRRLGAISPNGSG
jgi:DNA-binding IclR family transcriptional regulator